MFTNDIGQSYFNWLISKVSADIFQYSKLLTILFNVNFVPIVEGDKNRAADGTYLRILYAREINVDKSIIEQGLNTPECTVLEMMVALAIRMENDIMYDDRLNDRTYLWFNQMLISMDLVNQIDINFNENYVYQRLTDFINRNYDSNGYGSLFTIRNVNNQIDMRQYEIWQQMQIYVNQIDKDSEHINI